MKAFAAKKYKTLFTLFMATVFIFTMMGDLWSNAYAQDIPTDASASQPDATETPIIEVINPYFSIEHRTMADGTDISGYIINGPPAPLPEYEAERAASMLPTAGAAILSDFPSYNWVFGCSAVSGAMIAGYYDRGSYPNMYTGPTNGGVMPITDTSWPTWSDGYETYPNNPLIASHNGVDGKADRGSIDDYWIKYNSIANDPYITNGWSQHTWGTAIGDFMKTSRSASPYNNPDGSTRWYNWLSSSAKLTCNNMEAQGVAEVDGTYGRKLFYEARGYTVSDCYNQKTDNKISGGFSLANFQAEIDAGYPVLLNLAGHSIVGYGYNGSTIYIRDTWDNDPAHTYTMPWGGSYEGMDLLSVSVVHLSSTPQPITGKLVLSLLMVVRGGQNQKPTNILLSNSTIKENQPINTVVGTLSTVDPNAGDTFTYSLVSGAGDTDNASFNISGNQLRSSAIFDYEIKNSYSVRIRTTDQGSLFFEKAFTITVTPSGNQSPTDILLSNSSIQENQPINTVVGTLSTIDPDAGDTFTYSLVSGAGSSDNASFNISGNQLRSSAIFDYETKDSYSVRIRTTDQSSLFFEKAFTITITPSGWETLVNTTFEGDFPGSWDVFDNDSTSNGEYYWAARNCRSYAGTNSGWAVGGGVNGNPLSCGSNYPKDVDSWMVYGPFSLVNATAARLDFKLWLNSEIDYDGIAYVASIDGINFNGNFHSGNSGGWIDRTLDLSSIYNLGDLRGQPQVWVAIIFISDFSTNYAEGAYVDNIVLRRCMETTCPGLNTISLGAGESQIIDKPWKAAIHR